MNEKTCWAYLADNPFFIDLFATFQDDQFCYFVMEPVLGGQLQDIMLELSNERLNEPSVMFYAGNNFCSHSQLGHFKKRRHLFSSKKQKFKKIL